MAELGDDVTEGEIGGTEVVPPRADAMRFVDDQERDRNALEQREKALVFQPLGRDDDDLHVAGRDALEDRGFAVLVDRRVQRDDLGDAIGREHVDLVFHQRDQRADDDGRSLKEQGRQLIAQALPRARREDRQGIVTVEDAGDDVLLSGIELREAEVRAKRFVQPGSVSDIGGDH